MSEFNALRSSTDYLSTSPDSNGGHFFGRMCEPGPALSSEKADEARHTEASTSRSSFLSSTVPLPIPSSTSTSPLQDLSRPLTCLLDGRQVNMTAKEWEEWEAEQQRL